MPSKKRKSQSRSDQTHGKSEESSGTLSTCTDIITGIREAVRTVYGEDSTDKDVARFICVNVDWIDGLVKAGEITVKQLREINDFMEKHENGNVFDTPRSDVHRTDADEVENRSKEPKHEAIGKWLGLLEELLGACRAFSRIELFLQSRAMLGIDQSLYMLLSKLPRIPHPAWVNPSVFPVADGKLKETERARIYIMHSLVCTSTGIMSHPDELVHILVDSLRKSYGDQSRSRFSKAQSQQFDRTLAEFRALGAEKREAHAALTEQIKKQKRGEGSASREAHAQSAPLMTVVEAYHAIAKLANFYRPYKDPVFAEAQTVFFTLRRELQKELNKSLKDTNFDKYPYSS